MFALILALTNQVALHDWEVRDGAWKRAESFTFWRAPLVELAGKTLGIVGAGRIGARVANIGQAFGMYVISHSPHLTEGTIHDGVRAASLDEVFTMSDVVSLNCPLTEQTRHLVDAHRLEQMKSSSLLINTARGDLVDSEALVSALRNGAIAGAGLDVVANEPIDLDSSLLAVPNLLITPHNAWTSLDSRQRLMDASISNVRAFLGGAPVNVVGS